MKFWSSLFLNSRFFLAYLAVVMAYFTGFFFPWFLMIAHLMLFSLAFLTLVDFFLLYHSKKAVSGQRMTQERLSSFDQNTISIRLENHYNFPIDYEVLDELPEQFQIFDFSFKGRLGAKKKKKYTIHFSRHKEVCTSLAIPMSLCKLLWQYCRDELSVIQPAK